MKYAFSGYVKLGTDCYREHRGLDFEQLATGRIFQHRPGVTISQQDNTEEALETANGAQLHYDACYAAATEWKHCLGVSTLTLQKLIGMTGDTFGRRQRIRQFDSIAMTAPVFGGDTLYAETEVLSLEQPPQDAAAGTARLLTKGINQNGTVVAKIEYTVQLFRAGKHPLDPQEAARIDDGSAKFSSHAVVGDGIYRESRGIYFEDFKVGERFEHRPGKTFGAEECRLHALRSLDLMACHSDAEYNRLYGGGRQPVTEAFLLGAVTALSTRTFGKVVANLGWQSISLPVATYAGDSIYASSTILALRESASRPDQGIVRALTEAFNTNGDCVCRYERSFLVYKSGMGPYADGGY